MKPFQHRDKLKEILDVVMDDSPYNDLTAEQYLDLSKKATSRRAQLVFKKCYKIMKGRDNAK